MAKKKAKKSKRITVRRLVDMMVQANAFVPQGANGRTFAVVKERKMPFNVKELEAAYTKLGEVVQVLKSGTPDAAASAALNDKIQLIIGNTAKASGFEVADSPVPPLAVAKDINALAAGLKSILPGIQARDLTLADKANALLENAETLAANVTKAEAEMEAQATEEEEAPTEETPAEEETSTAPDPVDGDVTPAKTPSTKEARMSTEPAPDPEKADEAEAEAAAEADKTKRAPVTQEAKSEETETETQVAAEPSADDQPMTMGMFKKAMEDVLQQVQTAKSAPSYHIQPPATLPAETVNGVKPGGAESARATINDAFLMTDVAAQVAARKKGQ